MNFHRARMKIFFGCACVAAVAAVELSGLRQELFPGEERIQSELGDLKKAQAKLRQEFQLEAELKYRRGHFIANAKDCWISQRDGKPEIEIPKGINQAAKLTGLKISALGELRQIKITEGISEMELSVLANDSLEPTARFIAEIYRANPKMRWKRCQIRAGTGKEADKVRLEGSIGFLCVSDEKLISLLGLNERKD